MTHTGLRQDQEINFYYVKTTVTLELFGKAMESIVMDMIFIFSHSVFFKTKILPEAKLSNQPDGRAQAVDGSGLHGGPSKVKLLVLLLLCNLASALVRAAPLPMKYLGIGRLGSCPPQALREKNHRGKK